MYLSSFSSLTSASLEYPYFLGFIFCIFWRVSVFPEVIVFHLSKLVYFLYVCMYYTLVQNFIVFMDLEWMYLGAFGSLYKMSEIGRAHV